MFNVLKLGSHGWCMWQTCATWPLPICLSRRQSSSVFQFRPKSRPVKLHLDSCTLFWQCPSFAVGQFILYSLTDSLICLRPRVQRASVSVPLVQQSAPSVRYAGNRGFLRRLPLTLYVILMFYCAAIRKALNLLSCQCVTWRDAFICMGMSFAECIHKPACAVCLAAGGNS